MSQSPPLAIISGAGAGLGHSLIEKFQSAGYTVVGLNRSASLNAPANFDIRTIDLTQPELTQALLQNIINKHGAPKVVIHNTAQLVINTLEKTTLADFEGCWNSMVLSAFILAKSIMQPMANNGGGAFIVSGATASLRGSANFSAFASAKFALRGLTQSLAREFQASNIHVVHTILDGIIDTEASRNLHNMSPDKMMKPEDIANIYWDLIHQPQSTWTHELDLRPQGENF